MRTLSSLLSSLLFCVSSLQAAEAIVSRDAQIDNVQLHYLTAGHGSVAVMDAFLPGVEGWEAIYDAPNVWHFRFNGEYPEKLVQGRERTYFEYFWNVFAADETHSIPEAERKAYTAAYARPGRMRAAWAYFASWPQLATEFAPLSKTKLTMPVLSIGGRSEEHTSELQSLAYLVCRL